jgi:Family of unknown function (DUF5335)
MTGGVIVKKRDIAPSEWSSFLDTFSRQHEGWLVTVTDISSGGGSPRVEAREMPLQGIFVDPHDQSIAVAVGGSPEHHLTHTINRAARLIVEQSDSGADVGLTIERQSGRSTRLEFRAAMRPEEVDGLAVPGAPVTR